MDSRWNNALTLCTLGLLGALLTLSCGEPTPRTPPTSSITSSSPPWAKLAVIQTGMPNPPQEILMRFEQAFTKLERRCPDEPARIGDFLYSGYNSLTKAGKSVTLLELTESVATMLETAAGHGGIPKMKSCAEPVALMATALLGS